ncbi:unnamed protein product [Spirodela intermedia]|uniref:Uncharacterized protein n=1 Tax=Spirodela intermedia TaxID=51605 RepID=A0A7I8KJF0_SPIIN|nr:unnamed protein product [Spirodela intermedia]
MSAPGERESGGNRLSPGGAEKWRLCGSSAAVTLRRGAGWRWGAFILKSAQQEEALHRIWYALRRWRLVSRRIVLFPTTACSSINRR